eukprot:GEMP01064469.1.p2 GENE.GEMP01064469.1~~GEMP01064469.1.p2  ORF type:complete len:126 (-),score=14.78 GEMP01064469.1:916-1293(-)
MFAFTGRAGLTLIALALSMFSMQGCFTSSSSKTSHTRSSSSSSSSQSSSRSQFTRTGSKQLHGTQSVNGTAFAGESLEETFGVASMVAKQSRTEQTNTTSEVVHRTTTNTFPRALRADDQDASMV